MRFSWADWHTVDQVLERFPFPVPMRVRRWVWERASEEFIRSYERYPAS